jgi:transcriptional regulator with XRE-family HTH domain
VAGAAQVSTGHLSQVERGLAEASSEVLRALCRALDLPVSALLRAVAADLAVLDLASAPTAAGPLGALAPTTTAVQARAA